MDPDLSQDGRQSSLEDGKIKHPVQKGLIIDFLNWYWYVPDRVSNGTGLDVPVSLCPGIRAGAKILGQTPLSRDVLEFCSKSKN